MDGEKTSSAQRVQSNNRQPAPELAQELLSIFNLVNVGLVVLDRQHRVIFTSQPGEMIAADSGEIRIHEGRFRLTRANCQQWLDEIVSRQSRDFEADCISGNLFLKGGRGETPLLLSVLYLKATDQFALLLIEPRQAARAAVEAASLYRFTNAEKRLLGELCLGRSLNEIGEESTRSSNTLRSQLRSMFRKTGTKRQGELIARMLQLGLVRQTAAGTEC